MMQIKESKHHKIKSPLQYVEGDFLFLIAFAEVISFSYLAIFVVSF